MKIGILGTGMVGRAHGERLAGLGHEVVMGTRDTGMTIAGRENDPMAKYPFGEWQKKNPAVRLDTFAAAAAHGEMVLNALNGKASISALGGISGVLKGKVLIDISNPLDFSKGMPPSLTVCNTDSLGEQIQKTLSETKVVKLFNTVTAPIQVNPSALAGGDHNIFMCGNDSGAKAEALKLAQSYGWKGVIDLGDITSSRAAEMMLPMWVRLWGAFNTPMFNFKIIKEA